jgi:hypothetical protein
MSLAGSGADSHAARRAWQRGLLLLGLAWALVVVVPDLYRVSAPLATLGFLADNSGLIYQVSAPTSTAAAGSPVAPALRKNDVIVLSPGACWHPTSALCRNYLAVFGGMGGLTYVLPGTVITLTVLPVGTTNPIDVKVAAVVADLGPATKVLLALDEVAAVVVLWLAFRLAWDAPSRMTIGFFLFAMWFNPGQYFVLYAWLQTHPVLLLIQEAFQAIATGAGYAGFLVFALRFPHNRRAHRLRHIERVAIFSGVVLALLQLASFLNVLGVPTETITRAAILCPYGVAIAAFVVVRLRLRYQSPLDYQRMRWVLWGCAIGIPAFIFADSNEATSMWTRYVWDRGIFGGQPDESVFELAFLLSGILAIFICAAVRHRRIVNVTPELRALAATVLALILGVIIEDRMHEPIAAALTGLHVPETLHFYLAIVPLVACSAAVHRSSHTVDHLFNRRFYHAVSALDVAAKDIAQAADESSVDRVLVQTPSLALELASAAVFREADSAFRCVASNPESDAKKRDVEFREQYAIIERLRKGEVVGLSVPLWAGLGVADDALVPALAVPVIFDDRLYSVAVYGAHQTGAALDRLEVDLLVKFAARAAIAYERLEMRRLRAQLGA